MQPALASTAVLTEDINYDGAVSQRDRRGRERPADESRAFYQSPVRSYLMSKKRSRDPRLKAKRSRPLLPVAPVTFPHRVGIEASWPRPGTGCIS